MGSRCFLLLNMCVVTDVVLAITVITVATGTIAELQLRIANICASAYGASVGVVRPCWCSGTEWNGLSLGRCLPLYLHSPIQRDEILDVTGHEEQIITKCHQREQVVGEVHDREAEIEHFGQYHCQINQPNDPSLNGDDEENQELAVGIGGGKGE